MTGIEPPTRLETDIIIIGGGATGAGVLRDATLRGFSAVLLEKNDLATGATGRNHGLLHSGARYAVNDQESAAECIAENTILKKVAHHCVEDCGGLFITLPEDDPEYHGLLLEGCRRAGIKAREISPAEAFRREPNLNREIIAAIMVPDGTIDPFRLTAANVLDATERGGRVLTQTEVVGLIMEPDGAAGVNCLDKKTGQKFTVRGRLVINASGAWGQRVAEMAGIRLDMFPSKGSMVIIDYRINSMVVNRCRPPDDGDIIVPGDTVSLIGTTSRKIPYDRIEEFTVDDDEIEILLADGEKLIPNVSRTRVLRAYSGVRPLIADQGLDRGRDISRGIVLIDHQDRDGLPGFITIAGGKLMTYRLMAEMTVDLAAKKLGRPSPCLTRETPLPGSETPPSKVRKDQSLAGAANSVVGSTQYRHGDRVREIISRDPKSYGLICECEMVTAGEVAYAAEKLGVGDLIDLRRRTRIGMGPCQGESCSYRAAGLLAELGVFDPDQAARVLRDFLEERWRGVRPVLWGDGLREMEFTYWIYQGLFGLGALTDDEGDET